MVYQVSGGRRDFISACQSMTVNPILNCFPRGQNNEKIAYGIRHVLSKLSIGRPYTVHVRPSSCNRKESKKTFGPKHIDKPLEVIDPAERVT